MPFSKYDVLIILRTEYEKNTNEPQEGDSILPWPVFCALRLLCEGSSPIKTDERIIFEEALWATDSKYL